MITEQGLSFLGSYNKATITFTWNQTALRVFVSQVFWVDPSSWVVQGLAG